MTPHTHVDISTSSILRTIFVLLAFFLLYLLRGVVIILLFAIVVASAVSPFATWLEKKRIPRLLSVLMLYLLIFGLLVLVSSMVLPSISQDISRLTSVFPSIIEKLSSSLDDVQSGANGYFDFVSEIQNMLDFLSGYLQQFSQSAINLVISVFGGVFSFGAIVVISFYLSVMKNGIESFLQSVVPKRYEDYAINLWKRAEIKLGRWLQGQMLLGLIVGLIVYIGLSLMGVNFALVSGILAMLFEIVPVAGPVLAAVPAIMFAFLDNPTLGLWVIVFYTAVQQVENNLLVPLILGKSTGLNPIVVILALLIGGTLAGISGAILAVPIAAVVVEVLDDLAKHKHANS